MLLLARPYPDEPISSALIRGCRHFGVALKQVLGLWRDGGGKVNGMSFFSVSPLPFFAELLGMDARTLLAGHTVLPYATAFSERDVWERAAANSLSRTSDSKAVGAVIQSAMHGLPNRRFCSACVGDDIRTRGESYWHLSHQLPGSLVCHLHGALLRLTNLRIAGVSTSYELPQDCSGRPSVEGPMPDAWQQIAVRVAELSRRGLEPPAMRARSCYREMAVDRGWVRAGRDVNAQRLAEVFTARFGKLALRACGLEAKSGRANWMSLMLHARPGVPFATLKHALMQHFLAGPPVDLSHKPSGPSARSRVKEDNDYAAAFRRVAANYATKGSRAGIVELLREAGCWGHYRHTKAALPRLRRAVANFQSSGRSHRPLALQMLAVPNREGTFATRQDLVKNGHLVSSKDAATKLGIHWYEMKRLQRDGHILRIRYAGRDWYPAFWCEENADRTALRVAHLALGDSSETDKWNSLAKGLALPVRHRLSCPD